MTKSSLLSVVPLGFPWATLDPFLFCVHHDDHYPRGNEKLGPDASLAGRRLGQDFEIKDGFRMYHGREVPGFPQHPHRGFETVTLVRRGFIDHSDSLGATARFGAGDAQWLTAGQGIVHSEMFPLLERDRDNPLELFQIWLNLRAQDKLVKPFFSMLWRENIPALSVPDEEGRTTQLYLVAGEYSGQRPPAPPPNSWASQPDSDLAIWTLKLAPHARFTLPPARSGTQRVLYFFKGDELTIDGETVPAQHAVQVAADTESRLQCGAHPAELLLLQGRPIGEPVAQHGPFVMNSRSELQQAYLDYQRTGFGGWPFPEDAPVHSREAGRFARHADGRIEHMP
ncbi:MAG TPA: pirin family protein [Polyangiaceae bacterium]|nr:pirin family protein [Polyangiaceae bacterium]